MPSLREQFGLTVRRMRLEKDWTQEELAERLGTSLNFLSYVERGMRAPSFETLEKLSAIFKVPVAELFQSTEAAMPEGKRVQRRTHGIKPPATK